MEKGERFGGETPKVFRCPMNWVDEACRVDGDASRFKYPKAFVDRRLGIPLHML